MNEDDFKCWVCKKDLVSEDIPISIPGKANVFESVLKCPDEDCDSHMGD